MGLDPAASFYQLFRENLVDLVNADRGSIQTFYEIARDNLGSSSMTKAIAQAILDHIKECPPGQKLPALYVLDMISKNQDTRVQYKALFEMSNLAQVVSKAWRDVWSLPEIKPRFLRVIHTWRTMSTFSPQLLDALDAELAKLSVSSQAPVAAAWNSSLHNPSATAVIPTDPRVRRPDHAVSGFVPTALESSLHVAHLASTPPAVAAAAVHPAVSLSSALMPVAVVPTVSHALTAGMTVPVSSSINSSIQMPARPAAVLSTVNGVVNGGVPPLSSAVSGTAHASCQGAVVPPPNSIHLPVVMPQRMILSASAPVVTSALNSSLHPLSTNARGVPVGTHVSTSAASGPSVATRSQSADGLGELASSSVAASLDKASPGHVNNVPQTTAATSHVNHTADDPAATDAADGNSGQAATLRAFSDLLKIMTSSVQSEEGISVGAAEFPPAAKLKIHTPGVVEELLEQSRQTRPKLLDLQFLENKGKRSKSSASRQWFVTTDCWLAGTTAAVEAAPGFFEEKSGQQDDNDDATKHRQPRDDSKRCCAISGEPFDMVFDDDTEKWWFVNCVMLEADDAAAYGVADGSYVKATALTSTTTRPTAADREDADPASAIAEEQCEASLTAGAASFTVRSQLQDAASIGLKRVGEDRNTDSVREQGTDLTSLSAAKRIRV